MKKLVTSYTFSASSKTIAASDFTSLEKIQLITNVTTNTIIYNFADPAKGGSLSGTTLTLTYATTSMSNTDKLQIFVDDSATAQSVSGTVTANAGTNLNTSALALDTTLTGGTQQSRMTDGTNTVNVLKSDGTAAGQNAQLVGNSYQSQSFSFNSIAAGTAYDVGGYRSVSVQINTIYTGTTPILSFQLSNDGTNWFNSHLNPSTNAGSSSLVSGVSTTGIWYGTLTGRYFRLNQTGAYTSGTTTGMVLFSTLPSTPGTASIGISSVIPGVTATTLGKAEDAASASGDTGVFTLGIRRDGAITTAPASTAGDYSEMAVDNYGQMRIAAQARLTNPTAAADGNGSILMTDKLGKLVTVGSVRDLKVNQTTTITTTAETTVVTAVAATFLDVYGIIVANTSASAVNIAFKDATAGTTRLTMQVPAGDERQIILPESGAIIQSAVNNNWTATASAAVTSLVITVLAVKNI